MNAQEKEQALVTPIPLNISLHYAPGKDMIFMGDFFE